MSLINDLKKIFFGAKAVASSAAEKATDSAKETAGEIKERAAEWAEAAREEAADLSAKAKDTMAELKEKIWEETAHAVEKGRELKDQAEAWVREKTETSQHPAPPTTSSTAAPNQAAGFTDPGPQPAARSASGPIDFEADDEAPAPTPKAPGALAETGDELLNQAAKAGAQALDQAKELGGKVMDVSEQVGGVLLEKGGQLMDKAMGLGDKLANKVEDLVSRAQEEADRESLQDATAKAEALNRQAQERADNAVKDSKSSLLDGKDDFFSKAERFARGEYHDTSLSKDPDHKPQGKSGKAAGFDDHDGDGNELIDDAIIDES